ncbi:MAG: glycosyltransferase, partial [Bacteroidetes bacterium]|nr:glycosyltransferase [Bacteroidota bacterium]
MNDKKICFVTCVNDDRQYEECVKYIQSLEIPEGHEVELISVKQATSIFNGYNEAMRSSDAKYKVYLHQDVFILNRSFIVDVLKLFHENTDLGLLGVVGAKTLPANGLWWESNETFGKVYDSQTGNMQLIEFKTAQSDYESVMAIDGLIMATQYDLPWREDIFTEWNFYDVSQSLEFLKAGYEVGVPGQKQPWCLHDNGVENVRSGYEENRLIFVEQYHKQFQPLVSVLIPTYNRPQYLKLALESVLGQTYKNIEIIISDDSTNFDTQEMVRTFTEKNTNIRYLKNEENLGQFINDLKLFDLAEGEYINFLMDDDLFHPQKIEKMMKYFLADTKEEITIVTSHRKLIDDLGNELPDIPVTQRLSDKDIISDGILFGDFILARNFNRIGEPTTPLFRKKALKEPFGMFGGRKYGCNVDVATWANLLAEGKIVFIAETLSYFRIHHGQQLHSHKMIIQGTADYAHIILEAPKKGFFKDFNVYRDAVQNCINYVSYILTKYAHGNNAGLESELDEVNVNLISLKELHIKLNEQLPLVSVLIPAYNRPHYLKLALQSVLDQTYKNIEIIICDDSTNDEVKDMITPFLVDNTKIHYYKNEKNLFVENWHKCLNLANGDYINYLMDDDLFHPQKIEKMMNYFLADKKEEITIVTSYRKVVDDLGNEMPDIPATQRLFEQDTVMDGIVLGNYMLISRANVVGEPTTAMFRRKDLIEKFGIYKGKQYSAINDLATWISLLSRGKVVYIS